MTSFEIKNQLDQSREKFISIAEENIKILKDGFYFHGNKKVNVEEDVHNSINRTNTYDQEKNPILRHHKDFQLEEIEIRNETSFSGALYLKNRNPVVLNMASATSCCGGFLKGSKAQEEYLARCSSLYGCLKENKMYKYHRELNDSLYSDWVIYSPNVVVFRDDYLNLIEEPWLCSILSSPACYAPGVKNKNKIESVMRARIEKLLRVGFANGHSSIVLSAWGCGAFKNDADMISNLFKEAIYGSCKGLYKKIIFSIVDWSENEDYIGPFKKVFL